jgi:tellurite methyltransferase
MDARSVIAKDDGWTAYYEAHHGRAPRQMLLDVVATFDAPGHAVDIGAGNGIETAAMLERGWTVLAIDAEPEAIERLEARVPPMARARLRTELAPVENVQLPSVDLVWAAFSLFFCDPGAFPSVWDRIGAAVRPGGRFAGQLLGARDSWASEDGITAFAPTEARSLFDGWTLERFDEEEHDGDACSGPKHWHLFHVVAQRGR